MKTCSVVLFIGDHQVRLIPNVLVGSGSGNGNGLVDGLLLMILWNQTEKAGKSSKEEHGKNSHNEAKPSIPLAKTGPEESKALIAPSNGDVQNGSLGKTLIEPTSTKRSRSVSTAFSKSGELSRRD